MFLRPKRTPVQIAETLATFLRLYEAVTTDNKKKESNFKEKFKEEILKCTFVLSFFFLHSIMHITTVAQLPPQALF